jgi:hypothetical protein
MENFRTNALLSIIFSIVEYQIEVVFVYTKLRESKLLKYMTIRKENSKEKMYFYV